MSEVIIRQYRKEDRSCVRDIAWNTAFIGEPASAFFGDKEILADFLTQYFTDYEPRSCFVAESNCKVVGYLIGTKNITVLEKVFKDEIAPRLLIKSLLNGTLLRKKNITFIYHLALSFLRGEFKMPDFSKIYPATLHINLERDFRNVGIGSKLVTLYLEYLTRDRISGVYLPTMSDNAAAFFQKQGFDLLHKGSRSYFRHILHKDVPLYIYGKRL